MVWTKTQNLAFLTQSEDFVTIPNTDRLFCEISAWPSVLFVVKRRTNIYEGAILNSSDSMHVLISWCDSYRLTGAIEYNFRSFYGEWLALCLRMPVKGLNLHVTPDTFEKYMHLRMVVNGNLVALRNHKELDVNAWVREEILKIPAHFPIHCGDSFPQTHRVSIYPMKMSRKVLQVGRGNIFLVEYRYSVLSK